MARGTPIHKLRARDVMTEDVVSVDSGMAAREAALHLKRNKITGGPVIDAEMNVVGVISMSDLLFPSTSEGGPKRSDSRFLTSSNRQLLAEAEKNGHLDALEGLTVADLMTKDLISVTSNTPIYRVAESMLTWRVHRVVIIDNRRLAGIVSVTDLLRALSQCDPLGSL